MTVRFRRNTQMRALGDIDANRDQCGNLPGVSEAGQIPDIRESSTALCVKRGAFAHYLLIRGQSRSRGSNLSDEAQCFKKKLRSPDSIGSNLPRAPRRRANSHYKENYAGWTG
jgi:hypothetical protein